MADIFADDFSLGDTVTTTSAAPQETPESNPFSFSNFLDGSNISSSADTSPLQTNCEGLSAQNNGNGAEEENPYSFQNFASYGIGKKPGRKLQIIDDDDDDSSSSSELPTSIKVNRGEESEVTRGWDNVASTLNDTTYDTDESEESEHLLTIEKLSKENISLRNELSKMRDEFLEYRRTANKRVTGLQKELEKVRKKEVDETRDLDNVVQMVEENLQKTTTRAMNAEATVAKLREEIKHMKEGGVTRERYECLQLEHTQLLNAVKEKSQHVAQLMRTAADKTEPHVKQLQSGVGSLRFFAQQFDDICKITELPQRKSSTDHS